MRFDANTWRAFPFFAADSQMRVCEANLYFLWAQTRQLNTHENGLLALAKIDGRRPFPGRRCRPTLCGFLQGHQKPLYSVTQPFKLDTFQPGNVDCFDHLDRYRAWPAALCFAHGRVTLLVSNSDGALP